MNIITGIDDNKLTSKAMNDKVSRVLLRLVKQQQQEKNLKIREEIQKMYENDYESDLEVCNELQKMN